MHLLHQNQQGLSTLMYAYYLSDIPTVSCMCVFQYEWCLCVCVSSVVPGPFWSSLHATVVVPTGIDCSVLFSHLWIVLVYLVYFAVHCRFVVCIQTSSVSATNPHAADHIALTESESHGQASLPLIPQALMKA